MDRQPEDAVRMEVVLAGCTIQDNASVTFTGTPSNEVISLSDNIVKRGKVEMTAVAGMSLSFVTDGFVSVRAINSMGQPVTKLTEISASMSVRFFSSKGKIKLRKEGHVEVGDFQMMAEPDANLRCGDIVTSVLGLENVRIGRVIDLTAIFDFDGATHHFEALMENVQS